MATYRALPYGISDFRRIRRENYYLVDKSSFITKLEETASFLFLIRPRRFGKSLFLSMLRYYYDIAEKDNFQELFKGALDSGASYVESRAFPSDAYRLFPNRRNH